MPACKNWRCEYCGDDFVLETGYPHFVINSFGTRTFFCEESCQKAYEGALVLVVPQANEVNKVV